MSEPITTSACAICGKPVEQKFKPFCSKRCADLDLHRWLTGRYAVPVGDDEDEDGAPKTGAPGMPEEKG